jgi:hypothetical protein
MACDGVRRASLKTIDPGVQKNPRWERERAGAGAFRLGPYAIERARIREQSVDLAMVTPAVGPRRPGWRYDLQLVVHGPDRDYEAQCTGHRVPTVGADYGEVADVTNDEVRIACDVQGEHRWHLEAGGRLDKNLGGTMSATDAPAIAPLKLEVLLWVVKLKLIRRHLDSPVLQLRRDRETVAAMIVSRPEWAWVAQGESAEIRGVALTTLAAIDALPLGFED